ncbi:MAG: sugar transferase [Candidatus Magasanikbacteria bacterium]|nr:sugar transferase [Candidatus Magasanikbacteria bacterium]
MKKFELILTALLVPLDAVLLFAAGIAAYGFRFTTFAMGLRPVVFYLPLNQFIQILFVAVPVWILIFASNGLYTIDSNQKFSNELSRVFFACTVGLAAITVYIFFRGEFFNSRFIVLAATISAIIFVSLGRLVIRLTKLIFYRYGRGTRHTVLIGSGAITDHVSQLLQSQKSLGYTIVARYPIFNEKVRAEILELDSTREVDEIILTNPSSSREETLMILTFAEEHHFTLKYSADLYSTLAPNMRVSAIADVPLIEFRRARLDGWGKISKRMFDLIGSSLLIVAASPFMLATTAAILMEDGKPVLFKNTRVGFRGHAFKTLKFRSMYTKFSTEGNGEALKLEEELIAQHNSKEGPIYKIVNDPRVTKVGRFIRRWSIDELPQFFIVFIGTISFVGPRAHDHGFICFSKNTFRSNPTTES